MIKRILFIIFFLVWTFAMLSIGYWVGSLEYGADYTSQEIFDAVNDYRSSKDLPRLEENFDLCNGISDRYIKLKSPDSNKEGHTGIKDWANDKIDNYGFKSVTELWSQRLTVETVMEGWKSSISHRLGLEEKEGKFGCVYADKAGVVLEIGVK